MKKRVLVLGISGMAGHVIYHYLKELNKYQIIGTSYRKKIDKNTILIDVTDFKELKKLIKKIDPYFIINAVGVLIKGSSLSVSNAILVNSYFPHFLKEQCFTNNAKLIHISTDCVFSGKHGNYEEDSFRDGDDVYARSKALGEIINKTDVTIRTSIIGPELKVNGEGLFHWIMTQKGKVNGFNNVYWSGVTTLQLAKTIDHIMGSTITGIYHLTNGIKISKYDLLELIKKVWNIQGLTIKKTDGITKDKSFINTTNRQLIMDIKYYEMLDELKEFMIKNTNSFYNHMLYDKK